MDQSSLHTGLPHFSAGLTAQPAWHLEMKGTRQTLVAEPSTIL